MNDDSDLARLFDEADRPLPPDAFVATVSADIRRARRRRLLRQVGFATCILATAAWAAPYAAEQTLRAVGWITDGLPDSASELAFASPLGWLCGALVTWRILRHRFQ